MPYDFSILQRAEDRWRDDLDAANRHRMLKGLGRADRNRSGIIGLLNRLRQTFRGRQVDKNPVLEGASSGGSAKSAAITGAIFLLIATAASPARAASPTPVPTPAEAVRNAAESVLGAATVKSVRLIDGGRTVLIRWESATYRPGVPRAEMREILYVEAILATEAVLWSIPQVVRIRFSMLHGTRMIATGDNWRGRGLRLMFALELGGGLYIPSAEDGAAPATSPGSSLQIR